MMLRYVRFVNRHFQLHTNSTMNDRNHLTCLAALGLSALAPATLSANRYDTVQRYLDTPDTFQLYLDLEGDAAALGAFAQEVYFAVLQMNPQMVPLPLNFEQFAEQLGLTTVSALGMTSTARGVDEFENRSFILLNEAPKGLLALYGTDNQPFRVLAQAPADADLAFELSFDAAALRRMAQEVAMGVAGPIGAMMLEQQLATELLPGLTGEAILAALMTQVTFFGVLQPEVTGPGAPLLRITEAGDLQGLGFDGVLRFAGAGRLRNALQSFLASQGLAPEMIGDRAVLNLGALFPPPINLFMPLGDMPDLLLLTDLAMLDAPAMSLGDRLADAAIMAGLPQTGLGFAYTSERYAQQNLQSIDALADEFPEAASLVPPLQALVARFTGEQVQVYRAEADGLLGIERGPLSAKVTFLSVPAAFGAGLGAAIAVPAFQQIQATSAQSAVQNNLRLFASSAQQYMLENGVSEATYDDIVGPEPEKYMLELPTVVGEDYSELVVTSDTTEISVTLPDGRVVTFTF